jgi:hypothetical protein
MRTAYFATLNEAFEAMSASKDDYERLIEAWDGFPVNYGQKVERFGITVERDNDGWYFLPETDATL